MVEKHSFTLRQLVRLSIVCALGQIAWYVPSRSAINSSGVLTCVFSGLILFLYSVGIGGFIKGYKNNTEKNISESSFYNTISIILFILYFLWGISNAVLQLGMFSATFQTSTLKYMPDWFIVVTAALLCIYVLTRKAAIKTVARAAEFCLPILVIIFILCFVLILPYIRSYFLEGFFIGAGEALLNWDGIIAILSAGGIIFLPLIFRKDISEKRQAVKMLTLSTITIILIAGILIFLSIAVNGVQRVRENGFALLSMTRRINLLGVLERPEGLGVVCTAFSQLVFFFFLSCISGECLCKIFKKPNCKTLFACVGVVTAAITLILSPTNSELKMVNGILSYFNLIFEFIIPSVAMLYISGRKGNDDLC